ncbi:hypothetical protein [Paenibacillus sp. FSL R5-0470]|uniref:hypothetical protein n=1 Tax=Paenibacillus sp. FSL R5-0470 TaxID=2921641 RepID=UPI0030DCC49B
MDITESIIQTSNSDITSNISNQCLAEAIRNGSGHFYGIYTVLLAGFARSGHFYGIYTVLLAGFAQSSPFYGIYTVLLAGFAQSVQI